MADAPPCPTVGTCHSHDLSGAAPLIVVALLFLVIGVISVVVIAVLAARRKRARVPEGPVDVTLGPDGSLTCRWVGRHGPGAAVYVPQHEDYPKVLAAAGGIRPGETRRIERFPA